MDLHHQVLRHARRTLEQAVVKKYQQKLEEADAIITTSIETETLIKPLSENIDAFGLSDNQDKKRLDLTKSKSSLEKPIMIKRNSAKGRKQLSPETTAIFAALSTPTPQHENNKQINSTATKDSNESFLRRIDAELKTPSPSHSQKEPAEYKNKYIILTEAKILSTSHGTKTYYSSTLVQNTNTNISASRETEYDNLLHVDVGANINDNFNLGDLRPHASDSLIPTPTSNTSSKIGDSDTGSGNDNFDNKSDDSAINARMFSAIQIETSKLLHDSKNTTPETLSMDSANVQNAISELVDSSANVNNSDVEFEVESEVSIDTFSLPKFNTNLQESLDAEFNEESEIGDTYNEHIIDYQSHQDSTSKSLHESAYLECKSIDFNLNENIKQTGVPAKLTINSQTPENLDIIKLKVDQTERLSEAEKQKINKRLLINANTLAQEYQNMYGKSNVKFSEIDALNFLNVALKKQPDNDMNLVENDKPLFLNALKGGYVNTLPEALKEALSVQADYKEVLGMPITPSVNHRDQSDSITLHPSHKGDAYPERNHDDLFDNLKKQETLVSNEFTYNPEFTHNINELIEVMETLSPQQRLDYIEYCNLTCREYGHPEISNKEVDDAILTLNYIDQMVSFTATEIMNHAQHLHETERHEYITACNQIRGERGIEMVSLPDNLDEISSMGNSMDTREESEASGSYVDPFAADEKQSLVSSPSGSYVDPFTTDELQTLISSTSGSYIDPFAAKDVKRDSVLSGSYADVFATDEEQTRASSASGSYVDPFTRNSNRDSTLSGGYVDPFTTTSSKRDSTLSHYVDAFATVDVQTRVSSASGSYVDPFKKVGDAIRIRADITAEEDSDSDLSSKLDEYENQF